MNDTMVQGIMEIIIYAQEMNTLVAFYRDKLGLRVRYPAALADYSDQMWVELDAGTCVLALHGGGQRRLGVDAPKIVFRVVEMERARATLSARGVVLSDVRAPAPGKLVCDGTDPEGNRFSLEATTRA
jgi:catechol 2,3-dioxygenase-like lactoylglutathione lyase family enzyme